MADSYLTNLFKDGVYCVTVDGQPYDSDEVYSTDATYRVALTDTTLKDKLPLALLFATMQIALADVSACKAESFMNKIQQNQDTQVACSKAINEAKKMQETAPADLAAYRKTNTDFVDYVDFKEEKLAFALVDGDEDENALTAKAEDASVKTKIFNAILESYSTFNSPDGSVVAIRLDSETTCTKTDNEPTLPELTWKAGVAEGSADFGYFDTDENLYDKGGRYPAGNASSEFLTESDAYDNYEVSLTLLTASGKTISLEYDLGATSTRDVYYTLEYRSDEFPQNGYYWKEELKEDGMTTDVIFAAPLTSTGSAYPMLSDEFIENCVTAGIYEFDGVELCEMNPDGTPLLVQVNDNGDPILDANGNYIPDEDGKPISKNVGLSGDQLGELISELEIVQEAASSTLQTDMVYAEDYLGQYNAYLNGGSSNIDDLSNSLQTIAQRI